MKKIIFTDLDKFSEATGAWNQVLVITKFNAERERFALMIYSISLRDLFVCRAGNNRYYRWLWFEVDFYDTNKIMQEAVPLK